MPFLEIKFSGSCAFVINDDREVDVYFLNPASVGHVHDSSHLHVPILTSSSGTIASTSADGPSPGRSSGLPLYLARWTTS
ncbi:MAG TPA: hypothetical protein VMZ90_00260, partial [Vicinamibacterales bacterium]|nr:hypothetical protein [Vicinamibacterales bacterium]